jgi:hypothetical protein
MSDYAHEDDHGADEHGHDDTEHAFGPDEDERVTSPMQAYRTTEVAFGAVILAIGLVLTFGLGLLL